MPGHLFFQRPRNIGVVHDPFNGFLASSHSKSIMSNVSKAPPVVALAPWTLKGTIYSFMFYVSPSSAQTLQDNKSLLYSPLEASSKFSDGKLVGGLASVQIIRYTESPVGPYDELVLVPGKFEYEVDAKDKDGNLKREVKRNLRVTRIYVSQEATCWNGRNSEL